jgi:dipeptidase
MFSIRLVDLADTTNFLGRLDMWELAEKYGLYKEGEPKDFTATFSDGEYAHKYYSGRRMWGVFRLLAPSADLPATYGNLKTDAPYPFAVPVDSSRLATPESLMAVMRDWYDGTPYTTGSSPNGTLAGGAFESPDRFSGSTGEYMVD